MTDTKDKFASLNLSDAEREELATTIAEREAAERELETINKQRKRLQAENLKMKRDEAIRAAAGSTFHDVATLIELVGNKVAWDQELQTHIVKGESSLPRLNSSLLPMSVGEYLQEFATRHPYLVVNPETRNNGGGSPAPAAPPKARSKSDLKTVRDKSLFIDTYGYDAWERLPVKGDK